MFFINNDFTKKVKEPCKVEELSDNMNWYKSNQKFPNLSRLKLVDKVLNSV